MGSQQEFTKLLGLDGFSVKALEFEDEGLRARIRIRIERRAPRRYPCGGCGRRCSRVRDAKDRTWDDLPWAETPGDAGLCPAAGPVPLVRDPRGAGAVRRPHGAGDEAASAANRARLPVDANEPCRCALAR